MKRFALSLWNDPDARRFLKFLVVGFMNTVVGYVLYVVFIAAGLAPQPALATAFTLGVMWNYMTFARLVFGTSGYRRLPLYGAVYLAVYVLNAGVLELLLNRGLHPLLAQAVILPFAAVLTFLGVGKALTGRLPVDLDRFRKPRG